MDMVNITNTLEYQLGHTIFYSITGGGGWNLPYNTIKSYRILSILDTMKLAIKLRYIRNTHKRQKDICNQLIKFFPELLKNTTHPLSLITIRKIFGTQASIICRLGQQAIRNQKKWYKGDFYPSIRAAYLEFERLQQCLSLETYINDIFSTIKTIPIQCNPNPHDSMLSQSKEIRSCQNLDLLDLGYDSISFIESNLSAIKEWLESDEFQNYYANVAYPPLLNPRTFDTTLPPEIAWDLNMPLHNYNFIWLYNSCCGGEATSLFFNHCGIDLVVFAWLGSDNAKDAYIRLYQKDKAYFSYTNIISNANKFACLLNKKTPIYYIVRDFISILKTALNHIESVTITPLMREFVLQTRYDKLFPLIVYSFQDSLNPYKPSITRLQDAINGLWTYCNNTKSIAWLKHVASEIRVFSMRDIDSNHAFDTFTNLAKTHNFNAPIDPVIFSGKVNRYNGLLTLPCTLICSYHKQDSKSPRILITTPQLTQDRSKYVDITQEILQYSYKNVVCLITQEHYGILKGTTSLYEDTKIYLQGYIKSLTKYTEYIDSYLYTEENILQYLEHNKEVTRILKNRIHDDALYLKQHYPHIIESWEYYQRFEQICAMHNL